MSEPLSVANVLDRAAERCAKPGAWCQGASARDQFGRDVRESKCVPVSRWMLGHASDVLAESLGTDGWNAVFPIVAEATGGAPTAWNDAPGRTQAEVVAKLREAADLARARSAEFGNIGADGVQS